MSEMEVSGLIVYEAYRGQTKYKPLTTNWPLGHVICPSGCGDIAISNQQYHCNSCFGGHCSCHHIPCNKTDN